MEAIFDDLSAALKEPRQDAWRPVRAFALDMAGKLAMGLAIGLGVGIGIAAPARNRRLGRVRSQSFKKQQTRQQRNAAA